MFRIRRVWDDVLPINIRALAAVDEILKERFAELSQADAERLQNRLRDPFKEGLRPILFVAEGAKQRVLGFAVLLHDPELHYALLEYVAAHQFRSTGGTGSALYEAVRAEAVTLGCRALFFECQPDDVPAGYPEKEKKDNAARLRFYESWDARPIVGTAYDTPVNPEDTSPAPWLVADRLGSDDAIEGKWLKQVIRSILEKKYGHLCPPEYVDRVVSSVKGRQVELRPPRYPQPAADRKSTRVEPVDRVVMVVNDRHQIHHVRERGYVESPVRIPRILEALEPTGWFEQRPPREFGLRHITAVHNPELVEYLKRASAEMEEGRSLYPYVFPVRNRTRKPKERSVLAGYYCIDTFTPIHRNSYRAAKRAVDCTLTAATQVLEGARFAYSLVRPPGHHAEHDLFGGFCYFNNAAVAAHWLTEHGKVAILDIDYHHGNGQQDIFYKRNDVLTVSIHGHPKFAYPYYTGFEDELGEGEGEGFNCNLPQPEKLDGKGYSQALEKALQRVSEFSPTFLVVALGLDPAKGDPTGTWSLLADDFKRNGQKITELGLPTLIVQEGGYRTRTLGRIARAFFQGLLHR